MKAIARFTSLCVVLLVVAALLLPTGARAEKEIKIGVLYPLTGGAAAAGRELRAGAELAAEIANTAMADINMTMAEKCRHPEHGRGQDYPDLQRP